MGVSRNPDLNQRVPKLRRFGSLHATSVLRNNAYSRLVFHLTETSGRLINLEL